MAEAEVKEKLRKPSHGGVHPCYVMLVFSWWRIQGGNRCDAEFFPLPLHAIPLMPELYGMGDKAEDLFEVRLWILNGWIYLFGQSEAIEGFKISWWHNENVFIEKLMDGGQKWKKRDAKVFCFFFFFTNSFHCNLKATGEHPVTRMREDLFSGRD